MMRLLPSVIAALAAGSGARTIRFTARIAAATALAPASSSIASRHGRFNSRCRSENGVSTALAEQRAMTINKCRNSCGRARVSHAPSLPLITRGSIMKLILTLLGVVLLVIAAVYFVIPADQLPGFFPGHEAGVTRVHAKHGIVSG